MPALPADIAAASRDVVLATYEDAAIAARYPSARDGSVTPATGYFDSVADAQTVISARGGIIGIEGRGRFTVAAQTLFWPDLTAGCPCAHLIDDEQEVDAAMLAARIELDLETERTSFEVFG